MPHRLDQPVPDQERAVVAQVLARALRNWLIAANVVDAGELVNELLLQQRAKLLGGALQSIPECLFHGATPLLHQNLLVHAQELQAFRPQAGQGGVELLFGLDAADEKAGYFEADMAVTGQQAGQLFDRLVQP